MSQEDVFEREKTLRYVKLYIDTMWITFTLTNFLLMLFASCIYC